MNPEHVNPANPVNPAQTNTEQGLLVLNSGSSSLKASLFLPDGERIDYRYEHIGHGFPHDHREAFAALLHDMNHHVPSAVGHRLVHGGSVTQAAVALDDAERARLQSLIPLAPLHLPGNLLGVDLCREHFNVPQAACFDTAFHASLPERAWRLPIPQHFGLRRYGFHGINYQHVARQLPSLLGDSAHGKIVVAHLGNGASLCLLEDLRSIDTSMGYTPAGGIPMGTRSGDLDPGVMLALAEQLTPEQLIHTVYHEMGLLALSNQQSNEMVDLLNEPTPDAQFAVDYFCYQVRGAIGALAAKAGGIDALVFTGGIGEHAAPVREGICKGLECLGLQLDATANNKHLPRINQTSSKPVLIVPADEERMIADLTRELFQHQEKS